MQTPFLLYKNENNQLVVNSVSSIMEHTANDNKVYKYEDMKSLKNK